MIMLCMELFLSALKAKIMQWLTQRQGGLLMQLESEIHALAMHSFEVNRHFHLLIKKSEI